MVPLRFVELCDLLAGGPGLEEHVERADGLLSQTIALAPLRGNGGVSLFRSNRTPMSPVPLLQQLQEHVLRIVRIVRTGLAPIEDAKSGVELLLKRRRTLLLQHHWNVPTHVVYPELRSSPRHFCVNCS